MICTLDVFEMGRGRSKIMYDHHHKEDDSVRINSLRDIGNCDVFLRNNQDYINTGNGHPLSSVEKKMKKINLIPQEQPCGESVVLRERSPGKVSPGQP